MENSTFSLLNLFSDADILVRLISIALLLASIWSWTVIIEKILFFKKVKEMTLKFEKKFWSGGSLDDLFGALKDSPIDPMSAVFVAAMREWKKSSKIVSKNLSSSKAHNLHQRIDRIMRISIEKELEKMENRISFLSTTGSIAPFVGLFGTVWGIMSSFSAISSAQSTSLAVIAPGIATALSTTALGLIAAIPAVIGFNKLSLEINSYAMRLDSFAGEFSAIISRQVDEAN